MNREKLIGYLKETRKEAREQLSECQKDGDGNSYGAGFEAGYFNLSNAILILIEDGEFDEP